MTRYRVPILCTLWYVQSINIVFSIRNCSKGERSVTELLWYTRYHVGLGKNLTLIYCKPKNVTDPGRTRTCNLLIRSQTRCPLRHRTCYNHWPVSQLARTPPPPAQASQMTYNTVLRKSWALFGVLSRFITWRSPPGKVGHERLQRLKSLHPTTSTCSLLGASSRGWRHNILTLPGYLEKIGINEKITWRTWRMRCSSEDINNSCYWDMF